MLRLCQYVQDYKALRILVSLEGFEPQTKGL